MQPTRLFPSNKETLKTESGQGFWEFFFLHHLARNRTIFKTEVTPELTLETATPLCASTNADRPRQQGNARALLLHPPAGEKGGYC
jgi:hypothetical protein